MEQMTVYAPVKGYANVSTRRFCPYCGMKNDPKDAFCGYCGQRTQSEAEMNEAKVRKAAKDIVGAFRREQIKMSIEHYATKSVTFGVMALLFSSSAGFVAMILSFYYASKANSLADSIGVARPSKAKAGKALCWISILLGIAILIIMFEVVMPKYGVRLSK